MVYPFSFELNSALPVETNCFFQFGIRRTVRLDGYVSLLQRMRAAVRTDGWKTCKTVHDSFKILGLTVTIPERQLRLYMGMWRDSLQRIPPIGFFLFEIRVTGPHTGPSGRPQVSLLRKVESYLKDTGMAGLASAWAMARRSPL